MWFDALLVNSLDRCVEFLVYEMWLAKSFKCNVLGKCFVNNIIQLKASFIGFWYTCVQDTLRPKKGSFTQCIIFPRPDFPMWLLKRLRV